jgi:hypothetical protein
MQVRTNANGNDSLVAEPLRQFLLSGKGPVPVSCCFAILVRIAVVKDTPFVRMKYRMCTWVSQGNDRMGVDKISGPYFSPEERKGTTPEIAGNEK